MRKRFMLFHLMNFRWKDFSETDKLKIRQKKKNNSNFQPALIISLSQL